MDKLLALVLEDEDDRMLVVIVPDDFKQIPEVWQRLEQEANLFGLEWRAVELKAAGTVEEIKALLVQFRPDVSQK
jgi:hypothetical protein